MSIGKRFLNMARSELNSLLDFAGKYADGRADDGDADDHGGGDPGLHGFTAKELEEELERRRQAHREVEEAIHGRKSTDTSSDRTAGGHHGRPGTAGSSRSSGRGTGNGGGTESEHAKIQKAYAALEVKPGADFETVRKAYRTLMRKYHPDHHTQSAAKQRAANEVAQRLTEAYKLLEKNLRNK